MTTRTLLSAMALILLMAAGPGGSDREPGGYAVRLGIVPAPGGGVQRLELPAAAIVALRNRDGSDVRVFDARGRAVPIARVVPATRMRRDTLSASPILGGRDTRLGARVSVRLDERGQARIAEVESANPDRGDVTVLGALLDARGITGAAERLELQTDIPVGQPVRFTVEASRDLDTWRPLGERILYRAPGAAWIGGAVALASPALDHEYLRVTWHAASQLIAPVTIRRAILVSLSAEDRATVQAKAPALTDDHSVEFVAPPAPLTSLGVIPVAGDGPTPIRILGRDEPEQPWTLLATGVTTEDGKAMYLDGATPRIIRIEADRRGPGFSAPPELQLGFSRQAVAFVSSKAASLTLAVGRAGAPDTFISLNALSSTPELPQAIVKGGDTVPPLALPAPDRDRNSRLQLVLWAVLLGAVGLLGGLVWLSWRSGRATPFKRR